MEQQQNNTNNSNNLNKNEKKITTEQELQYMIINYFSAMNPTLASRIGLETKLYFDSNYIKQLIQTDKLFELEDLLQSFIDYTESNELLALFELRHFIVKRALHINDISIASKYFTVAHEMKNYPCNELQKKVSLMTRTFSLINDNYKEQIGEFRNHNEFRMNELCQTVIELLESSQRINEIKTLPQMSPNSLKALVSMGMKFTHVKQCNGHANDNIDSVFI